MPDLVSKQELASLLDVSEKTIQRLTAAGELRIAERRGQTPYYDRAAAIEAYGRHAEAVRVTLQHPGSDIYAQSRLLRVQSHTRRLAQKLDSIRLEFIEYAATAEAWAIYRQKVRSVCYACADEPPHTQGLKSPLPIGILVNAWQNDLLTKLADFACNYKNYTIPTITHDLGEHEDIFDQIEAERARANYYVADINNTLADIAAGTVVQEKLAGQAMSRRIVSSKSRIESAAQRLSPQLIGLGKERAKEMLLEIIEEALEELTDLDRGELMEQSAINIAPEKTVEKEETE